MFSLQDAETCLVSCLDLPLLCTEDKVFVCKLQLWFTSPTLDSFLQNTCYLENFLPSLPAALSSSTLQLQHNFKFLQRRWGVCGEFPSPFISMLVSSPGFLLKMAVGIRTGKRMCLILCFWEPADVFLHIRQHNITVKPAACTSTLGCAVT